MKTKNRNLLLLALVAAGGYWLYTRSRQDAIAEQVQQGADDAWANVTPY